MDKGIERLALNVIKQAIKDSLNDTLEGTLQQEALDFLTKYNQDFEDWCLLANLIPAMVFAKTSKIQTNKLYWKLVIKRLNNIDKNMLMLQERINKFRDELTTLEIKKHKFGIDYRRIEYLKKELVALQKQLELYS